MTSRFSLATSFILSTFVATEIFGEEADLHHLVGPRTGRLLDPVDVDRANGQSAELLVDGLDGDAIDVGDQLLLVVVQVSSTDQTSELGFFDIVKVTAEPRAAFRPDPLAGNEKEVLAITAEWQTEESTRGEIRYENAPGYFRYDPATERVLVVPVVTIDGDLNLPDAESRNLLLEQMEYAKPGPDDPAIRSLLLTPPAWNPGGEIFVDPEDPGSADAEFHGPFAGGVLAIDVGGTLTLGEDTSISGNGLGFVGGYPSPRAEDQVTGGGYYGEDGIFRLQRFARPFEGERRFAGGPGWTGPETGFPGGGGGGGGLKSPGDEGSRPLKGGHRTAGGPSGKAIQIEPVRLLMGSGGGGAGSGAIGRKTNEQTEASGGRGGTAGAIIYIRADRVVFAGGTVSSRGLNGTKGNDERAHPPKVQIAATGGGGGGSGGTVWVVGPVEGWPEDARREAVQGGRGGAAGEGNQGHHAGNGGDGGKGRVLTRR